MALSIGPGLPVSPPKIPIARLYLPYAAAARRTAGAIRRRNTGRLAMAEFLLGFMKVPRVPDGKDSLTKTPHG
jgi:hypothetical protein